MRSRHPTWAVLGAGSMSGVLVREGVYGLRFIAATTSSPFWWAEVVAGIGLLLVLAVWRLQGLRQITTAVVVAFATSAASWRSTARDSA